MNEVKGNQHVVGKVPSIRNFFEVYSGGNVVFNGKPTDVSQMSCEDLANLAKKWLGDLNMLSEPKEILLSLVYGEGMSTVN